MKAACPWAADGAAAAPGPLDGGDLVSLVNGMELMCLPRPDCPTLEEDMQRFLNAEAPRPDHKLSLKEEATFCMKRDAMAQQYQMAKGGKGS